MAATLENGRPNAEKTPSCPATCLPKHPRRLLLPMYAPLSPIFAHHGQVDHSHLRLLRMLNLLDLAACCVSRGRTRRREKRVDLCGYGEPSFGKFPTAQRNCLRRPSDARQKNKLKHVEQSRTEWGRIRTYRSLARIRPTVCTGTGRL